jgi:hypothetical protein
MGVWIHETGEWILCYIDILDAMLHSLIRLVHKYVWVIHL